MSINKLTSIVSLLNKVGVTDLQSKQALQMTLVLKNMDTVDILGEKGLMVAKKLKSYEI